MKILAWKSVFLFSLSVGALLIVVTFLLLLVRNDIATDAKEVALLEYRLLKAQDVLRALEVKVDDSVQPDVLQERIGSVLTFPSEGQVIRIVESNLNDGVKRWLTQVSSQQHEEGV